ncbi:hypothetical protein GF327_03490 [Candidatus Woesearchaeota archaeon]|nr:hypothetical protein [Candidatus Woesearchaeota archaeon]
MEQKTNYLAELFQEVFIDEDYTGKKLLLKTRIHWNGSLNSKSIRIDGNIGIFIEHAALNFEHAYQKHYQEGIDISDESDLSSQVNSLCKTLKLAEVNFSDDQDIIDQIEIHRESYEEQVRTELKTIRKKYKAQFEFVSDNKLSNLVQTLYLLSRNIAEKYRVNQLY